MRGVSAQSLDKVLARTSQVTAETYDLLSVARELFDAVRVVDSSNQLVRLLSDSGRDADLKVDVVRRIFTDSASREVVEIVSEVARHSWSEQHHVLQAIELAGAHVLLKVAEHDGVVDKVSEELLQFAAIVRDTPELSTTFDSTRESVDERVALLGRLLSEKVTRSTLLIAQQAVRFDTSVKVPARLEFFAEFASARRDRLTGTVTSAIALKDSQRERLERILATQYGRAVTVNYEVDPDVVGGMHITVGDDLYDATIAGRVRDVHAKLGA